MGGVGNYKNGIKDLEARRRGKVKKCKTIPVLN
jgi:hypothetical protein